jgi:hypothetical protein
VSFIVIEFFGSPFMKNTQVNIVTNKSFYWFLVFEGTQSGLTYHGLLCIWKLETGYCCTVNLHDSCGNCSCYGLQSGLCRSSLQCTSLLWCSPFGMCSNWAAYLNICIRNPHTHFIGIYSYVHELIYHHSCKSSKYQKSCILQGVHYNSSLNQISGSPTSQYPNNPICAPQTCAPPVCTCKSLRYIYLSTYVHKKFACQTFL